MWSWAEGNLKVPCSPEELEGGCSEEGCLGGEEEGEEVLTGETPFGHTVYKPSIMSVCVFLKRKV